MTSLTPISPPSTLPPLEILPHSFQDSKATSSDATALSVVLIFSRRESELLSMTSKAFDDRMTMKIVKMANLT